MSNTAIPAKHEKHENTSRDSVIIKTSVIGILANILLAAFKAVAGIVSHSIAVVMDAVNNLSDATSSVITIVGVKLAGRQPDRKHPFGHGRTEYLTALVISVIVLYAGVTSLIESVKKIITPETPDYGAMTLIIIAVAVAVKLVLGRYVKSVGKRVNSDALVNSGEDARLDAVISASTLVAAAVYLLFGLSLEAYLAAVISLVIIKSGIEMLRETISRLLGERAEGELADGIRETIMSFKEVHGVYDLILNNYGPDSFIGSVHIEVDDTATAAELDPLTRKIAAAVYAKHHVILGAVGVYSVNNHDGLAMDIRETVERIAKENSHILETHGFYLDQQNRDIRFDLVVDFDAADRRALCDEVAEKVKAAYPGYTVQVALDTDFNAT